MYGLVEGCKTGNESRNFDVIIKIKNDNEIPSGSMIVDYNPLAFFLSE